MADEPQIPDHGAELAHLRAELAKADAEAEKWDVLTAQTCPRSVNRDWFANTPNLLPCPWCALDGKQAELDEMYRAARGSS